jgi:hypothetical protein
MQPGQAQAATERGNGVRGRILGRGITLLAGQGTVPKVGDTSKYAEGLTLTTWGVAL